MSQSSPPDPAPAGEHPFAELPYQPRSDADPAYVGPPLLAPGPRGQVATRGAAAGGDIAVAVILLTLSLFAIFSVVEALLFGVSNYVVQDESVSDEPMDSCYPVGDEERESDELRDHLAWGSATRLRSRVAIVGVRFGGGGESWPAQLRDRVQIAVIEACFFFQREALSRGLTDLICDPTILPLEATRVELPSPVTDELNRVTGESAEMFRSRAHEAVQEVLGQGLLDTVRKRRRAGYDEVAFLFLLPKQVDARDFASPASFERGDTRRMPELAFVFAGGLPQGEASYVSAHETLHLFGAGDLYMVRGVGPEDEGDVMNERCTALPAQARIRDATAFTVGWKKDPPTRPYRIPSELPPAVDDLDPVRIEILHTEPAKRPVNRRKRR